MSLTIQLIRWCRGSTCGFIAVCSRWNFCFVGAAHVRCTIFRLPYRKEARFYLVLSVAQKGTGMQVLALVNRYNDRLAKRLAQFRTECKMPPLLLHAYHILFKFIRSAFPPLLIEDGHVATGLVCLHRDLVNTGKTWVLLLFSSLL